MISPPAARKWLMHRILRRRKRSSEANTTKIRLRQNILTRGWMNFLIPSKVYRDSSDRLSNTCG